MTPTDKTVSAIETELIAAGVPLWKRGPLLLKLLDVLDDMAEARGVDCASDIVLALFARIPMSPAGWALRRLLLRDPLSAAEGARQIGCSERALTIAEERLRKWLSGSSDRVAANL